MARMVKRIEVTGDDPRRTFTSKCTDGKTYTYRLTHLDVLSDGSIWSWSAQITKAGMPFKNGMGLTLGGPASMARDGKTAVAACAAEALSRSMQVV